MKYKVNWPLNHDGVIYPADSEIELSDEEARALMERSEVIEPIVKPFSKKLPTSETA